MTVLIRAVFMMLVLVGLPAAWVYYGPLPPGAQQMVDRVVELAQDTLGWDRQTQSAERRISAPRYNIGTVAETPPATTVGIASESQGSSSSEVVSVQVEPLLERLRRQGVSEYSLVKWGKAGQLYRFCCAMPWDQNDEITRQFEAVADNPFASIEQVVREVSRWQAARQRLHQVY